MKNVTLKKAGILSAVGTAFMTAAIPAQAAIAFETTEVVDALGVIVVSVGAIGTAAIVVTVVVKGWAMLKRAIMSA